MVAITVIFFKSILDYFDDLPPVEKAAYPDGHRDSIDSLYQEQLDQWGTARPNQTSNRGRHRETL